MLDVLYVVSGLNSDQPLFRRLKCSIDSLLKNDYSEIVIGICDTSPASIRHSLEKHLECEFNYHYHRTSGDYNKSFNINLAVRELSAFEHLMVTDVDMVFQRSHISDCLSLAKDFPVITYITHALKAEYYSSDYDELIALKGTEIPMGGGFFARKDALMKLNGFDEAYYGWGAEDSDFYNRAEQLFPVLRPCEDIKVVHLWHRENDHNRQVNERRNLQRYLERTHLLRQGQIQPWEIRSSLLTQKSAACSQ